MTDEEKIIKLAEENEKLINENKRLRSDNYKMKERIDDNQFVFLEKKQRTMERLIAEQNELLCETKIKINKVAKMEREICLLKKSIMEAKDRLFTSIERK